MKDRIKANFNRAWKTYDQYCGVQKSVCEKAIDLLLSQGEDYSLAADFACGTGVSTQCLADKVKFEKLIAIDFCESLLEIAREKNKDARIETLLHDFDERVFQDHHLDLLFCNMGLQWSLNLKNTLTLFRSYLKDTGLLVFSMPLQNTFAELKAQNRNSFHTLQEIVSILDECQYQVKISQKEILKDQFSTAFDAIRSIKSIGANCVLDKSHFGGKKITRNNVSDFFVNPKVVSLTYHIGIFVAKKTKESL
jgi:malonyl-CoA O-methyltransferase